jgi:hypothetical protein
MFHQDLLFSALEVQSELRKNSLGVSFWEKCTKKRLEISNDSYMNVIDLLEMQAIRSDKSNGNNSANSTSHTGSGLFSFSIGSSHGGSQHTIVSKESKGSVSTSEVSSTASTVPMFSTANILAYWDNMHPRSSWSSFVSRSSSGSSRSHGSSGRSTSYTISSNVSSLKSHGFTGSDKSFSVYSNNQNHDPISKSISSETSVKSWSQERKRRLSIQLAASFSVPGQGSHRNTNEATRELFNSNYSNFTDSLDESSYHSTNSNTHVDSSAKNASGRTRKLRPSSKKTSPDFSDLARQIENFNNDPKTQELVADNQHTSEKRKLFLLSLSLKSFLSNFL